jgi:GTP cyclohydrolase I
MVTSKMIGAFKDDPAVRNEFMEHLRRSGGSLQ